MSTVTTSKHYFGSGTPYYYGKMTLNTSSSNTTTTVSWKIELIQKYGSDYGVGVKITGAASGTVTGYATTVKNEEYTLLSKSGTVSFSRGTSAATKSFTVTAYGTTVSNRGSAGGSVSKSSSVSIPALAHYTVSYNANGGSGAPSSQTKYYGKTLTLQSTKPTRTGYTFQGWATSSGSTTVKYSAGASYTANSGASLYAVWKANTWTVSYDANGGSGAPGSQTKTYGQTLKLSTTAPTRTNYKFLGWSTSSTATTATYQAGGSFTTNATTKLYAVWELAYIAPKITGVHAYRVDSTGANDDEGTYAHIEFNWSVDSARTTVQSITIAAKLKTSSTYTTIATPSVSGTSGTVTINATDFAGNAFDTEQTYDVIITVADTIDSASATTFISLAFFTMDFLEGGRGIAFGAPSKQEGFYCAMPTVFVAPDGRGVGSGLLPTVRGSATSTDAFFVSQRTDTNRSIAFGVGSGGTNAGIWDVNNSKWLIYSDSSGNVNVPDLYIDGHSTPLGSMLSDNGTFSCASGTSMRNMGLDVSIPVGSWVVSASIRIPSASGTFRCGGSIYWGGDSVGTAYNVVQNANGGETALQICTPVSTSTGTTLSLGVRQNSGSTLTITYYWRAMRIA